MRVRSCYYLTSLGPSELAGVRQLMLTSSSTASLYASNSEKLANLARLETQATVPRVGDGLCVVSSQCLARH